MTGLGTRWSGPAPIRPATPAALTSSCASSGTVLVPRPPTRPLIHAASSGCISYEHLRWATAAENNADKLEHGTHHRGERAGNHVLTEADVLQIRRRLGTEPQLVIARSFGVSPATVSAIAAGRIWKWLREESS